MSEKLLTYESACEILGVTQVTIRRYIRRGLLRVTKIGGKTVRFKASDLEDFINNSARPAGV